LLKKQIGMQLFPHFIVQNPKPLSFLKLTIILD